jgi:hypothetical protein
MKRLTPVASFVALFALAGCAAPLPGAPTAAVHAPRRAATIVYLPAPSVAEPGKPAPTPWQEYQESVRAAALHGPQSSVPLRPIPADLTSVTVATFTEWGAPPSPVQRYTWVSLPDQLRSLCRGKADPVLAIQQILGLPPAVPSRPDHSWQVVSFTAPRSEIFRPCPTNTDIAADRCSAGNVSPDLDDTGEKFFLNQMWGSYRDGFVDRNGRQIAGGSIGYPFTGMGWSYNWSRSSTSHVGVSEYVVKPGAAIGHAEGKTPAEFCNGG